MRYLNLLDSISRVKSNKCYSYNNTIIFAVPSFKISKAIGLDAINIKKLQEKIGKRVRIIKEPNGIGDAEKFICELVSPVKFKSLEVKDKSITITAGGMQNKASLLGRNKRRLLELKKIVLGLFNADLKIL